MPEPSYGYSESLWVAAHSAVKGVLLGGSTAPHSKLVVYSLSGQALVEVEIDTSASEVDSSGILTLGIMAQPDPTANIVGVAAYASVLDREGVVHARYPCSEGTSPVPGHCVLNDLTIAQNRPVFIVSLVIPPGLTI